MAGLIHGAETGLEGGDEIGQFGVGQRRLQHMQGVMQAQPHDLAHAIVFRFRQAQNLRRLAGRAMDRGATVDQGAVDVEDGERSVGSGHIQTGTMSKATVRRGWSPPKGTVPCHRQDGNSTSLPGSGFS
ncbi:hypothetical protein D3C73_1069240 [compost metagenome]